MIKKLSDTESEVRKQAALSLMKLKAIEAIEDLEKTYIVEKDEEVTQVLKLVINQLKKDYAVIVMSEYHFPVEENENNAKHPIARPAKDKIIASNSLFSNFLILVSIFPLI